MRNPRYGRDLPHAVGRFVSLVGVFGRVEPPGDYVRAIGGIRKRDLVLAGCATFILCGILGCATPRSTSTTTGDEPGTHRGTTLLPSTEADISGTITEVRRATRNTGSPGENEGSAPDTPVADDDARRGGPPRDNGNESTADLIGVVLVEENPDEETGSQKDSVTVTRTTRLVEQGAHDRVSIGFEDLEVGQRARAWYTGPVAESYPRQATARVIVAHPPTE